MNYSHVQTYLAHLSTAALLSCAPVLAQGEDDPWRLAEALALPYWLSLSGTVRTRYETLDSQFRAGGDGGDQILVTRTTLMVAVEHGGINATAEFMDSRAMLDDRGTPISTGVVNPAELLQAYIQWHGEDLVAQHSKTNVRMGRITMDIGSRRFVARNRFRNTINAFTGIDWQWRSAAGRQVRAFFTLPVDRKPNDVGALRDNRVEFDDEKVDFKFWGFYLSDTLAWGGRGEFYYFGINEQSRQRPTRNRELSTLGLRIYREPQMSQFDYEIESAYQFGSLRISNAAQRLQDLDHFAHFQHAEIGYSFAHPWAPRVIVQYDFASGDDSSLDGDNERLDTLFGARRFEFGPTGIYGPFARSNLNTPGLRVQFKPSRRTTSFVAYRAYWLASDTDAWTTARVRDVSGSSGHFIGHQIEARVRWDLVPGNVRLESGIAHLFAGKFMDNAPNTNGQGDATYLYTQVALTF